MLSILWKDTKSLNQLSQAIMVLSALFLLLVILLWMRQVSWFTIQSVSVRSANEKSLKYVTIGQVQQIMSKVTNGNLFAVNLQEIHDLGQSLPWVRHIRVQRVWPNSIKLVIEEHQPLGRWVTGALINTHGEAFLGSSALAEENFDLPELIGPVGTEKLVADRFKDINQWLKNTPLKVRRIELSQRYSWKLVLNNQLELRLGQERHPQSLQTRVKRFVKIYPMVQKRFGREIQAVDLSYRNGFAVGLKQLMIQSASDGANHTSKVVPTEQQLKDKT